MAPSAVASPPDRRNPAAVQRWLERRAARLAALIARRLTEIVNDAYDRFLRSLPPEDALIAAGDFSQFDSIPGLWADVISEEIDPEITATYLSAAQSQFDASPGAGGMPVARAEAFARVINDQAAAYAITARNRLIGVGDAVYRHIADATASAIRSGASNEALKDLIEKNTRFSEYRADMIARTEILNAYGNGDWASASALGEFGPMEKTWLATGDARTRPEHLALDGETLPMDEPFDAGGEPMMFPHDPGASAGNVVNCRCILNFLYAGDERPDGTIVGESEAEGEILAEETMLEQEMIDDEPDLLSGLVGEVRSGDSSALPGEADFIESLTEAEVASIRRYTGQEVFEDLNYRLRFGYALDEEASSIVADLDSAIAKAGTREEPFVVYRGMGLPDPSTPMYSFLPEAEQRALVADMIEARYPVGAEMTFGGQFASSSTTVAAPLDAALSKGNPGVIFEVQARSGAPINRISLLDDEFEVILPRDRRYRVVGIEREVEFYDFDNDRTSFRTLVQVMEIL